ncbi:hypothetical protein GGR58DRAFT_526080 [Xylaria digitata]|nr:hypothetical protein GGR58DRAFT_526080 [Xylaria digitata]
MANSGVLDNTLWLLLQERTPILSALILASLLLAASIEILAQKASKEGGLSLLDSIDSIPQATLLVSTYLPTFLALIYGLLWSWVGLDAKRIQPWLELSKSGGSTAQNSLFLDYPSEFIAFAPFRAARRHRWLVFYTGTIVVIVSWLITPLQSSIFGVGPIHLTRQVSVSIPTSLVPITDQASLIDAEILNDAFAITWLGRNFPSPMTANYALLPFEPVGAIPSNFFRISNGRGCEVDIGFFGSTPSLHDIQYSMLYVGYYQNAHLDYFLEGPSYGKNASHQFLAISASRNGTADQGQANYTSITALFCQPQYSKRNVSVALSRDTLIPVEESIVPNDNTFEYLLGTGRPPIDQVRDYPKEKTLEQYPQLVDNRIEWPITNMVGFAIGSQNYSAAELHDPYTLAAGYTMAHRSLFSTTVSRLLSNGTGIAPVSQVGVMQYTTYGVIALLLVAAALAGRTIFHRARRKSLLISDPSSISDILGTLQCSEAVLPDLVDQDRSDDATPKEHIGGNTYFLRENNEAGKITLCLDKSQNIRSGTPQRNTSNSLGRDYKPIRPSALSPVAGIGFIGSLLIGLDSGGMLTPPSSNFEVVRLLENYIPTVFATLLGPFWIMVNRIYCVFRPFSELQKGRSLPQHSVLAEYTSMPPQLVIWRSAKARRYLLAFMCLTNLLANILALSLNGLFNDIPRVVTYKTMVRPTRIAVPSRDDILEGFKTTNPCSDHFQALMANLSSRRSLPSWTDDANFYLPFDQPRDRPFFTGDRLKAKTLGFGIKSQCSPIHLNDFSGVAAVKLSSTNMSETIALNARLPNGSYVERSSYGSATPLYCVFPGSPLTQEIILGPLSSFKGDVCWSKAPWVAGWMLSMFDVTVDADGNIIDAEDLGDPGMSLQHWSANLSQSIVDQVVRTNTYPSSSSLTWHNETLTTDWINHLLTLMMGNRSVVDPAQEVPDFTTMRPLLEELQQRLGAVLLGLNPSFFQEATDDTDLMPATIIRIETRIFLSEPAFILSVSILALYLLISVAVMPTSLGSLLAYSVASQAVEDFSEGRKIGNDSILRHTYTFGRYIGKDRKPHIGIERDPFVVKLDRDGSKSKDCGNHPDEQVTRFKKN